MLVVVHLAEVTVRAVDLISRVCRTHQLVYRCARKKPYASRGSTRTDDDDEENKITK